MKLQRFRTMVIKTLLILAALFVVAMSVMGWMSQRGVAPGLDGLRLSECLLTTNCVNSESNLQETGIRPLPLPDRPLNQIRTDARVALLKMGAEDPQWEADYLATTFTSKIFHFVDDLELRLDEQQQVLHIRSASRVGKSDFSANRKRVETFRKLLEEAGW